MTSIVVIAEGIEHSFLKSIMGKYQLSWWENALKNGTFSTMDCGPVPYEPSNLTSAFTGVSPGYHGCFSFWEIHSSNNEKPRILESNDIKMSRIWNWPELSQLKCAVLNIPLTHPPQELNGYLITYPMKQTLHACYPGDLQHKLNKKGIHYGHDVSAFYRGEARETFMEKIIKIAEYQLETALHLGEQTDVLFINLTMVDRVSHFFWSELNQSNNLHRQPYIIDAYQFLDSALQQLQQLVHEKDFMLVFSEIGFGPLDGFVSIDKMLQKAGFQKLDADGHINPKKSLARESVQGSHGINLIKSTTNIYEHQVDEVCNLLLQLRFDDGAPIIAEAKPRDLVYTGPWTHLAPDIIIKPANSRRPPMGDLRWAAHVNRHLQTGWHRDQGFCLLVDKKVSINRTVKLEAIAPTIASLLGRNIPKFCTELPLI